MKETVFDCIAGKDDDDAIGAPGGQLLSYSVLRNLVAATVAELNRHGIGRNDRVAISLSNGPEMATLFLAVAAGATAAPLNPVYRQEEFEFYLGDLRPKALVIGAGDKTPARAAAEKLGIPVVELHAEATSSAGSFSLDLDGLPEAPAGAPGLSRRDDIALVLHTSGTTARPKIVPLANANLAASARHIATVLGLRPVDRCLNIMPLFHIHGLIAAVLSSLFAGAAVVCTPGFNALKFFAWLGDVRPSWYTAVPTMHQAILARAGHSRDTIEAARLRFVRSSSASLPPQVMAELEATFSCPVIEAYGMTEAAHQMASNPLPPQTRKAGSVGLAAGPEVAIMSTEGVHLPRGTAGEVIVRGPNIMGGYADNPAGNKTAFVDGWFRTGDEGYLDDEGYLFLTGRLKEMINRGGEKISPLEIDTVLLDHPAIAQCVTFAMPHASLGEEVGAAVVLREGAAATERELRDFAAVRLAPFKVPRRVFFLSEIPKGATGKVQRIGLAARLGIGSAA